MLPKSMEIALEDMKGCEQTAGQSVYEHGISVWNYFNQWKDGEIEWWNLPKWATQIQLSDLHPIELIELYTKLHDIGKPYCKEVVEGHPHFPHHAEISKQVILNLTHDELLAIIVGNDMVLHTASAEEIDDKLKNEWSKETALTLLIVSLCEIHSNASLFGGISSTSFKIKWKVIDRRGRQIVKYFNIKE